MNSKQFIENSESLLNRCLEMLKKKNSDYANDTSPFANFEYSSELAGIEKYQSILQLLGMKLSRIRELMSGKEPNYESLEDSILDAINYLIILNSVVKDNK
jgi:hypothetical protein